MRTNATDSFEFVETVDAADEKHDKWIDVLSIDWGEGATGHGDWSELRSLGGSPPPAQAQDVDDGETWSEGDSLHSGEPEDVAGFTLVELLVVI